MLVNPIGLEDYAARVVAQHHDWYQDDLKLNPYKVREYQKNAYYAGNWNDAYEALAKLQMNMTKHPDYPRVAWCSDLRRGDEPGDDRLFDL